MALGTQLEDSPTEWNTSKEEELKDILIDGTLELNTAGIRIAGVVKSFLENLSEDTTPQLGGALDAQNNNITSIDKVGYSYATGEVSALGNLGATEAIDWSTAAFFTGTLDADVAITHTSEGTGEKITLMLSYDGTAQRTITWSDVDKWVGGSAPTSPSAAGEVLVVTMIFDGTNCYADGGIVS